MRLVFMGTSSFAVPTLERVVADSHQIAGVITQPDRPAGRGHRIHPSPVRQRAAELGLTIHQPASIKSESARQLVEDLRPEMTIVVAYGRIIPGWMIRIPRFGTVNVHGSLLPKYRGAAPINWAIANGETETGVCTMQVDEGLDTGPVYLSKRTSIGPDETAIELWERLSRMGADLMAKTLDGIADGTLQPVPQDSRAATHAPLLEKRHGVIDWTESAQAVHNKVRAFVPWPCAATSFRKRGCKILRSKLAGPSMSGAAGEIAETKGRLAVRCGDGGRLEVVQLQIESHKPVFGVDFVNGMRAHVGERFGTEA